MKTTIKVNPHPGQIIVHNSTARFKVLAAGRRWGKTRLGVNECIEKGLSGGNAWWVAPTYKMTDAGWKPLQFLCSKLENVVVYKADKMVEFIKPKGPNGLVSIRSADDPQKLRGDGLDLAVLDEAAYIHEDAWYQGIRASLSDHIGSALFISTPRGQNYFWKLYLNGANGVPGWESFTFPTSNNPYILSSEIETARNELPDMIFRQEYLAEFINDFGGVFRNLQAAATLEMQSPVPGKFYLASVDVASSVDFTVVSIFDIESKEQVFLDRFNRVDYPVLEDRLVAIYNKWFLQSMTIEKNSIGKSVIDHLVQRGLKIIPFLTTNATKQTVIQNLQSAFEHEQIKILNHPILLSELLSFESSRNPSGTFTFTAPAGMHDDCVMSLAIGWFALNSLSWLPTEIIQASDPINDVNERFYENAIFDPTTF